MPTNLLERLKVLEPYLARITKGNHEKFAQQLSDHIDDVDLVFSDDLYPILIQALDLTEVRYANIPQHKKGPFKYWINNILESYTTNNKYFRLYGIYRKHMRKAVKELLYAPPGVRAELVDGKEISSIVYYKDEGNLRTYIRERLQKKERVIRYVFLEKKKN